MPQTKDNAVAQANMPFLRGLLEKYPNTLLQASGNAVGLPDGTQGNSEVGHITIGSGRVVNQFLRRFEIARDAGEIAASPALDDLAACGVVHIIGLMSDGNVHSSIDNTIYITQELLRRGAKIWIHFISDGRDTPPDSAAKYIARLQSEFADNQNVRFATLCGRYYAMDRNTNWDRTQLAYDAIACGVAPEFPDVLSALQDAYAAGETDEFIRPRKMSGFDKIEADDGIFFANYRSDRARQILKLLHQGVAKHILTFNSLSEDIDKYAAALLPAVPVENTLGDVLAANGLSQLRIAETEKYTHTTYFFDAERKMDYPKEQAVLIPSPDVATFDLKPEMSAAELTDTLIAKMFSFDVSIVNFANGDIVGHTGNLNAAVLAMNALDVCLSRFVPGVIAAGGAVLITADHGNAEDMSKTSHTTNPVPFILVANDVGDVKLRSGAGLSAIAPTMLQLLGLPCPLEMDQGLIE